MRESISGSKLAPLGIRAFALDVVRRRLNGVFLAGLFILLIIQAGCLYLLSRRSPAPLWVSGSTIVTPIEGVDRP